MPWVLLPANQTRALVYLDRSAIGQIAIRHIATLVVNTSNWPLYVIYT